MTKDAQVQTQISFVHTWSLTDDTGTYINASSGTLLWNEIRVKGGKGIGLGDSEPGHRPETRTRPIGGYSPFR